MGFHSKEAPRPNLRDLEPSLRRARLLAAREYMRGSSPRRGILSGQWDGGDVVRRYMKGEGCEG